MKKFSVEYNPHALKKMRKLDTSVRKRIIKWIETNLEGCENPRRKGFHNQRGQTK